jgi:hypothetical protein
MQVLLNTVRIYNVRGYVELGYRGESTENESRDKYELRI